MKKIIKILKLKIKYFFLDRVCFSYGCEICPFTQTKNTNTCIICRERFIISCEIDELLNRYGEEDEYD